MIQAGLVPRYHRADNVSLARVDKGPYPFLDDRRSGPAVGEFAPTGMCDGRVHSS